MQGWLLFSPNTIQEENIPDEKAELDEGKSPSKRLRSVLFILWKQRGKQGDFETYYRAQIERLIDQIKEKLERTRVKHQSKPTMKNCRNSQRVKSRL